MPYPHPVMRIALFRMYSLIPIIGWGILLKCGLPDPLCVCPRPATDHHKWDWIARPHSLSYPQQWKVQKGSVFYPCKIAHWPDRSQTHNSSRTQASPTQLALEAIWRIRSWSPCTCREISVTSVTSKLMFSEDTLTAKTYQDCRQRRNALIFPTPAWVSPSPFNI